MSESKVLVKRIDMALHVQELCAKHKITVSFDSLKNATPQYWANRRKNAIQIRPTKNTGYYVSALHEIGHLIGQQQNGNLIHGSYPNKTKDKTRGMYSATYLPKGEKFLPGANSRRRVMNEV